MSSSLPPLPPTPDYSFKPQNVDTGPAQLALQKQAQQAQMDQQGFDNTQKTIKMASELAQSFVEQAKNRQQADAVKAFTLFNPAKKVMDGVGEQSAAIGPQQSVAHAKSLNDGQPMQVASLGQPSTGTVTTQGATAQGQSEQRRLLANVMASSPKEAAKSIMDQAFPNSGNGASFGGLNRVQNTKTGAMAFAQADKNGQVKLSTGEPFSADWVPMFAPSILQDPNSGMNTMYSKTPGQAPQPLASGQAADAEGNSVPTSSLPYHRRSIKEKSEITGVVKELRSDELFQTAERALQTVGNFDSVLNQDLAVAKGAIRGLAGRVLATEKGVMTDKDVDRQLGQDYGNKFRSFIRGAVDGKLTDQDYRELQTIIRMTAERSASHYALTQQQNLDSLTTQYGVDEKTAKTLLKYRDFSQVFASQEKKGVEAVDRPVGITKPEGAAQDDDLKAALRKMLPKR